MPDARLEALPGVAVGIGVAVALGRIPFLDLAESRFVTGSGKRPIACRPCRCPGGRMADASQTDRLLEAARKQRVAALGASAAARQWQAHTRGIA